MPAPTQGCSSCDRFTASTQQALVLLLTQQLADAQIRRADTRGSERLWQEVAALDIDPERITALLYSGQDIDDREALRHEDDAWLNHQQQRQRFHRGWGLRTLHLGQPRRPQRQLSRASLPRPAESESASPPAPAQGRS
jgi:hypothetical protein